MVRGQTAGGLVGRSCELATLVRLREQAVRGRGQLVVVEGEAGIGKTRLVDEALSAAEESGIQVLRAGAEELERRRPFGVVADCLGINPATDGRRAHIARLLQEEVDRSKSPAMAAQAPGREFAVVEAMVALVEESCAQAPIAIVVEDLQWADTSSLVVLHRLARAVPQLPAVVVVTTRPLPRSDDLERLVQALGDGGATNLRLGPLEPDAVAALAHDLLGAPPGARLRRQLDAAGGNPLFVLELVRSLEAAGALERNGQAEVAAVGMPASLPMTILHALSFLPHDALEVLRVASVLGSEFTAAELAAVADRRSGALVGPLRASLCAGVLKSTGTGLAFRHDLIREALYADLPETLREALHTDAARVLANAGAPALRVAEHLMRGTSPGDGHAVSSLHQAARQAAPTSPAIAVELLERALELAGPSHPGRHRLVADHVVNLMWSGRVSDAQARCRELLDACTDPSVEGPLRLCLAQGLVAQGRAPEAVDHLDRVASSPDLSQTDRAEALAWAAHARWLCGDLDGGEATAEAARALAEEAGDAASNCIALAALALIAHSRNQLTAAVHLATEAVRLGEQSGDPEVHRFQLHLILGVFLLDVDRTKDAEVVLTQGRQLSENVGSMWNLAYYELYGGLGLYLTGRWDDAITGVEAGIQASQEMGSGHTLMARSLRSLIALHRDDLATAEEWLRAAEEELATAPAQYRSHWAWWARALLAEARGDRDAALRDLREAWQLCAPAGLASECPILGPDLVRLAVESGERALACDVARAVEGVATANPGIATMEGAALRCRGLVEDSAELLLRSVAAYRRGPRPFAGALAAEDAAAALARQGRRDEVRALFQHACAVYEALGAVRRLAQAEARLRILGVRRGVRGARQRPTSGWASLTDTEQAVVALVAQGLSNPEIAARMFLSRRTVQTHVSHILAKLGLASRVEVAAAAVRRGC